MLCHHCCSALPSSRLTLSDWAIEFSQLISTRTLKAKTLSGRLHQVAKLVDILGGAQRQISTIRPVDVATAIRSVFDSGKEHLALRLHIEADDMFNEAIIAGHVGLNPVTHLKRPRPRVRRSRLTYEQLHQIRRVCIRRGRSWLVDAIDIALVTGLRIGDIVRLRVSHVVDGHLLVTQQKTGVRQAIPLDLRLDAARVTLRRIVERCASGKEGNDLLVSKRCGKAYHKNYLTSAFSSDRDSALPRSTWGDGKMPATFHEIRSLSERMYRDQGQDTKALLGHKRQSTTDLYNDNRDSGQTMFKVVPIPGRRKLIAHIKASIEA
ncbi:tyrosine-type recombinase/integrase [Pseudomonas sp. Irchel 3E13]|uniref:tyrosine-type recombinase/integrase n=1 Tax=Pseudomonas sp. Irchel 3E13 TaxID=2008975 RepID=UPI000BA3045E